MWLEANIKKKVEQNNILVIAIQINFAPTIGKLLKKPL